MMALVATLDTAEPPGYRVETGGTLTEALALLGAGAFDLVMSDIGPDVERIHALVAIRRRHPALPIVAITPGDQPASGGESLGLHGRAAPDA